MQIFRNRTIHLWTAVGITAVATICIWLLQSTKKDAATLLGTIGVFLTIYGVAFSVVELLRLASTAQAIKDETAKMLERVEALQDVKTLSECQAAIEVVSRIIDQDELVPKTTLMQVIKTYSFIFHEELKDSKSIQRKNTGILGSYMGAYDKSRTALSNSKLSATLSTMTIEISTSLARQTKVK